MCAVEFFRSDFNLRMLFRVMRVSVIVRTYTVSRTFASVVFDVIHQRLENHSRHIINISCASNMPESSRLQELLWSLFVAIPCSHTKLPGNNRCFRYCEDCRGCIRSNECPVHGDCKLCGKPLLTGWITEVIYKDRIGYETHLVCREHTKFLRGRDYEAERFLLCWNVDKIEF
jgi:hypothetical protein